MNVSHAPNVPIENLSQLLRASTKQTWHAWWDNASKEERALVEQRTGQCSWLTPMGCSKWFAEQCLKHRPWLSAIVSEPDRVCLMDDYQKRWRADALNLGLGHIEDESQLMRAIRLFRHYEIARIIYRDFNRMGNTQEICAEISALAEYLLDLALNWQRQKLEDQLGVPSDEQGKAQQLSVIGMGKIGGNELNLCSDIDLIFVYPESGKVRRTQSSHDLTVEIDNQQFFEKLARAVIRSMSAQTDDGIAWKMDVRLRPYGTDGPLVSNHQSMELYYETQGREWERFAMCRARALVGNKEDTERLLKRLQPFAFRRYLDFQALGSLKELRQMTESHLEEDASETNIKLGWGGIREAEFSIQFFQLVYGGKQPMLRCTSFYRAIEVLLIYKHIQPHQKLHLETAYSFLRNVEHALQAYANRQTHSLPSAPKERAALANVMSCANWSEFTKQLNIHRQRVHDFFTGVANNPDDDKKKPLRAWQTVWRHPNSANAIAYLASIKNKQAQLISEPLLKFHSARNLSRLSVVARNYLDALMPNMLQKLTEIDADAPAIQRCFNFINSVLHRPNYLALLQQKTSVLERVIDLCVRSPWLADQLTEHAMLLDELLDSRTLYQSLNVKAMGDALEDQIHAMNLAGDDNTNEQSLMTLKDFHSAQLLHIAVQDLDHLLSLKELSQQLSHLAEVILSACLELSMNEVCKRLDIPEIKNIYGEFCIVAYGKLGCAEMNYSSDLDLVFLYNPPQKDAGKPLLQVDHALFFTRLSQQVLSCIRTSRTYQSDIRLRPSGQAGTLVSSYDAFCRYQQKQAWTWEHQALIVARAVIGDTQLCQKFENLRRNILDTPRELKHTRIQIIEMREKMRAQISVDNQDIRRYLKHAPGGLVDISFIVQHLVLSHAHQYPDLLAIRHTDLLLAQLAKNKLIAKSAAETLQSVYNAFNTTANHYALCGDSALSEARIRRYQNEVRKIWKTIMGTDHP